jgi:hypothetical protein
MTGDVLRAASTEKRVAWLASAAERLSRATVGACEALAESTGLSPPMVAWGVRTTLATIEPSTLHALADEAHGTGGDPISSLSIVLAGNLFTAAARAVVVPLLLGIPVTVKASSRETLFPTMLRDALRQVDAELGDAIDLVVFAGGDVEREAALIEGTEVTAVYGADSTVDAMKQRHPNASLIAHGHGVSATYCGPEALLEDHIQETIANIALDICAYDQRGCLSPQIIYAAANSEPSLLAFAERLATEGLNPLAYELPRGPLPIDVGAAQAQWRGIAEVEGALVVGNTYGIAIRPPQPVRWSPGYRNVTLAPVRDRTEAVRAMEPFGPSLKCVGADPISIASLRAELDRNEALTAYVCPLGTMQTPPLDAPADGKPIYHGLLKN